MKRSSSGARSQPSISKFFQPASTKNVVIERAKSVSGSSPSPAAKSRLSSFSHGGSSSKSTDPSSRTSSSHGNRDQLSKGSKSEEEEGSEGPEEGFDKGSEGPEEIIDKGSEDGLDEDPDIDGASEPAAKKSRLSGFNMVKTTSKTPSKTPKTPKTTQKTPSKPSKIKLTPLETQFINLKTDNRDKLLAIQVGYKFKFFGEDAVVASKVLNIMLLPGSIAFEDLKLGKFAYCSIPDNRLHIHLQRLLNYGYKVAVVKQTETAAIKSMESSNKGGLFERKITGIYTKATYMGDEISTGEPNNYNKPAGDDGQLGDYILCIDESQGLQQLSLVAVQPLTGDIIHDTFKDNVSRDELETRLVYLLPSEVLVINKDKTISKETLKCLKSLDNSTINIMHVKALPQTIIEDELAAFFTDISEESSDSLAQFYQVNFPLTVQSCVNELIKYLQQFKLSNIFTITSNVTSFARAGKYMLLPSHTIQALELFRNETDPTSDIGTLTWLLDHTRTKMGQRLLRKWISKPLIDIDDINSRLDAIDDITTGFNHFIDSLKNQLTNIGKSGIDLEKLLIKIHYSSTYNIERITRKEVYHMLKCFNEVLQLIKNFGEKSVEELKVSLKSSLLKEVFVKLLELSHDDHLTTFLKMINPSVALNDRDSHEHKIGYFNLGEDALTEQIEIQLREISTVENDLDIQLQDIRKLLKRPNLLFVTNLKDTHLIEVRNGKQVDALPKDWIKISGTKSVSRFRTPVITQLHKKLQYHNDLLIKSSDIAFNKFLGEIDSHYQFFHSVMTRLSTFDCLLSFAASSLMNSNYTRPTLVPDVQKINVKRSRNPIIENLPHSYSSYVANNIDISYDENRVLIITGPNMGGKSSYVKQVALITIMCQIGCFIPCDSAEVGIFDSIFIRMGASDNILKGKSTFMVEMLEAANIIASFTSRSLIILDEIGRGTGTNDGIAIAYSILHYLIQDSRKPLTLFITHYPSLHTLEFDFPKVVANYHMGFVEKKAQSDAEWPEIIFLYTLAKGVVSNSYGLNVAKLAGISTEIIQRAFEVSERLKSTIEIDKVSLTDFATEFAKIIKKSSKVDSSKEFSEEVCSKLSEMCRFLE